MDDALTPLPQEPRLQPRTMDFPDAIRQIINGKKVARVSWGNKDYCLLKGEWLTIYRNGEFYAWKVNDGDMESNDWTVVGEVN